MVLPSVANAALDVATRSAAVNGTAGNFTTILKQFAPICAAEQPSCLLQAIAVCESQSCYEWITSLIFPFLALSLGCLLKPLTKLLRLPYTLLLLASGIILGLFGCAFDLGYLTYSLRQWVHLSPPDLFFYVFLAPLIFEAAFNTQWHIFRRLLIPILTAAFVIVVAQTALIAGFTKGVVGNMTGWVSWWPALMFGAMLSATDPISVTATLKALGASENLGTLIEGESLVNDGSAFVIWEAFFHNAQHEGKSGEQFTPGGIIAMVLKSSLGGALLGVLFALIVLGFLTFIYDEFEVETTLTVVVAFLGFWTAQSPAHLSGVIANVASGLLLSAYGRPLISKSVRHPLAEFWELIGWIANTIVFVHAGVLTVAFVWPCSSHPQGVRDYLLIFGYFFYLQAIRVFLFALAHPILSWRNKWFTWRENLVVGMSGLRGAVSLILALNVAGALSINEQVRTRIVLWTTGIVILSLVVNGLLIPRILSMLKLDKPDKTRIEFFRRARATTVQATLATLDKLCVDIGFRAARWSYVLDNVLPQEWLTEDDHAMDFAEAAADMLHNPRTQRASLEFVLNEQMRVNAQAGAAVLRAGPGELEPHRLSLSHEPHSLRSMGASTKGAAVSAQFPRLSTRESLASRQSRASNSATPLHEIALNLPPPMSARSMGLSTATTLGTEEHNRRSIDFDVQHYETNAAGDDAPPSDHGWPSMLEDHWADDEPRDREVRRRVLMSMLSHVRALSNSTLIEYSALVSLEEDIQSALDANDEGRDYDLFSQLNQHSLATRVMSKVVNPQKFTGESIVVASVIFSVLTEILKQNILSESAKVRTEAEVVYEAALFRLNELEHLNPKGFRWVHSQFAIHLTVRKQDCALDEMRNSGVIDAFEYKVLHEELIKVRRRHAVHARRMWRKQKLPARKLLPFHPMFADWRGPNSEMMTQPVLTLEPGHVISFESSAFVLVLEGAIRPLEEASAEAVAAAIAESSQLRLLKQSPILSKRKRQKGKTDPNSSVVTASTLKGQQHHWCYSSSTSLSTPKLACSINNAKRGGECPVAKSRLEQTPYMACSIAEVTTIFSMTEKEVRDKARQSKAFRDELTRSLARQLVLHSVVDQKTHHLRMLNEALSNNLDVHSVIGRAFRILERLPYMSVIRLHKSVADRGLEGAPMQTTLQGPGVLINGRVRVSIVDTSGLVGAVNLLHESLEGPALLPSGGLIIEEVQDGVLGSMNSFLDGVYNEVEGNGEVDIEKVMKQKELGPVLAHVLIDDQSSLDSAARARLQRWTAEPNTVDMNGRFGMFRHVTHCSYRSMRSKDDASEGQSSQSSSLKSQKGDDNV